MLRRLLDVRPEERRPTAIAFLVLFGILAAHTILETARDALFLARLPPSQLPWMYLAMAAHRGRAVAVDHTQTERPSRARDPPGRVRRRDVHVLGDRLFARPLARSELCMSGRGS